MDQIAVGFLDANTTAVKLEMLAAPLFQHRQKLQPLDVSAEISLKVIQMCEAEE